MVDKNSITAYFKDLQDRICTAMEEADGQVTFHQDLWERPGGGGGRTRIMADGRVIEKGGVNFSAVFGDMPEPLQKKMQTEGEQFYATGVSIVMHPQNPQVPIIHMNVRYFEMSNGIFWFGGGIDLTPHYVVDEDAAFFHQALKNTCDQHHISYYPEFKKWADDYFFIKHRNETRGVGGIFFDRLSANEEFTKEDRFAFVKEVGETFVPVYTQLIAKNKDKGYGEEEKQWQYLRRGRYVEFNLVYDQGTKFGLETAGRIESILMSLPKQAGWLYNFSPRENSAEARTLRKLKKDIDWISG